MYFNLLRNTAIKITCTTYSGKYFVGPGTTPALLLEILSFVSNFILQIPNSCLSAFPEVGINIDSFISKQIGFDSSVV